MRRLFNRKGQNMAEYAIIFGVVIAVAAGMSGLIKEGVQDRVVSEIRKIGDDQATGIAAFDIRSTARTSRGSTEDIDIATGGAVTESARRDITSSSTKTYSAGN